MDKDPEDVRYNFIRWLNNDISTAIGPSRAHPLTGQILDADVVLTDGWIRAFWGWLYEQGPELAVQSMTPETLRWLEDYPDWDPRLLLATPEQRDRILARRAERKHRMESGEEVEPLYEDPILEMNDDLAEIGAWLGHDHRQCLAAHGLASHMAFARLSLESLDLFEQGDNGGGEGEVLDDIPEWFVGPMVADLVCHEVGHTLGLRHNFKGSSVYTLQEINSEKLKGKKAFTGSVMDYNPPNFNMESGETQGDFAMIGLGPYDMWAIEYGYTFGDTKEVLKRVAEPELVYQTDDDVHGPDPLARTYDFSADPLDYAENQMRLVKYHRDRVLDKYVKDGESWSRARRGYQATLMMQMRMTSMMANWIGGAYVSRARKGDPEAGPPTVVVEPQKQRAALKFVIDNAFNDEAFGLTPELLAHMTVDKWSDQSPGERGDPTWPAHDRVLAVQASTLTMILNPTTLRRVYDNEFRTPAEEDALTLAELLQTVSDAVFTELLGEPNGDISEREPMISSLRRDLQSAMTGRLISLSLEGRSMPRAVRTLASMHLREIDGELTRLLNEYNRPQLDAYTAAHLVDLHERIDKALNAIQVTNDR